MSLPSEEKTWLLARSKRLLNYLVLKIGLFAIASVWGIADFANAGNILRILYALFVAALVFYIYFYWDTRKYLREIDNLIRSSSPS